MVRIIRLVCTCNAATGVQGCTTGTLLSLWNLQHNQYLKLLRNCHGEVAVTAQWLFVLHELWATVNALPASAVLFVEASPTKHKQLCQPPPRQPDSAKQR